MIIATIAALIIIFGGSGFSFDVFKDAADKVIEDKARVKQIKAITKEADKELKAFNTDFKNSSKELVDTITCEDVTRAEVDATFDTVEARRAEFQEKIIALRFKAKNLVDRKEWEAMYASME